MFFSKYKKIEMSKEKEKGWPKYTKTRTDSVTQSIYIHEYMNIKINK